MEKYQVEKNPNETISVSSHELNMKMRKKKTENLLKNI